MSAAGEIPGRVLGLCHGIAIGYGGFLVGAPLINALADVMGQVKCEGREQGERRAHSLSVSSGGIPAEIQAARAIGKPDSATRGGAQGQLVYMQQQIRQCHSPTTSERWT